MDLATFLGVLIAWGCVLGSMALSAPISSFFDVPSLVIVGGGTLASSLMSFTLKSVLGTFGVLKKTFLYPLPSTHLVIERLVTFANLARRDGLLALEDKIEALDDEFLSKGLRMVIDGLSADAIRQVLENDVYYLQERHGSGKRILESMGASAPAFGMLGTLIGLVAMLQNMTDPSSIGVGMAVALLTTLYGSFLANCICLPLAAKLDLRNRQEVLLRTLTVEGVLSIQACDKPHFVEEKLKSFLAPAHRIPVAEKK